MGKQPFNFGDSLAFIGLLLAVTVSALDFPVWLKALLLVFGIALFSSLMVRSHWTNAWPRWVQGVCIALFTLVLLCIGIPQLVKKWKDKQPSTTDSEKSVQLTRLLQSRLSKEANMAEAKYGKKSQLNLGNTLATNHSKHAPDPTVATHAQEFTVARLFPQPTAINNAPGGFATSGGTIVNPTIINYGDTPLPPRAILRVDADSAINLLKRILEPRTLQ